MSDLVTLLTDLVAIDSVNPDLTPGGAGEQAIADFVAAWLERAGIEVTIQETAPGRPNVIGRVRGTGGGKSLMLNAHMDTVGIGGPDGSLQARVDGDRLYGRGSYDMKGSLAAIMLATAELARNPIPGDVILTAVTDEEYASLGTEAIVRDFTADGAIITEPSHEALVVAHKGFVWATLTTEGVAAHGSQPAAGVDAIAKMGRVLVGLEALGERLTSGAAHPLLTTGSVHASLIEGGLELSTYPDRCQLQIERRTIPGEDREMVARELAGLLEQAGRNDPAFRGSYDLGLVRQPFEIAPDAPIVEAVRSASQHVTGIVPPVTGGFGWMDSALLGAAGIPTVIYGPAGEGAHAASEWVDLPSVDRCRQVYLDVARSFCR